MKKSDNIRQSDKLKAAEREMSQQRDCEVLHNEGLCCQKNKNSSELVNCDVAREIINELSKLKPLMSSFGNRDIWMDVMRNFRPLRKIGRVKRAVYLSRNNRKIMEVLQRYCDEPEKGEVKK